MLAEPFEFTLLECRQPRRHVVGLVEGQRLRGDEP